MATTMPPTVFNVPPPSGGNSSFRNVSATAVIFNPNMPPPSFNAVNSASGAASRFNEAGTASATATATASQNPLQSSGSSPANVPSGFQQRQYRFKPTVTVNLAEAEGYGRRLRRNMAQVRRHIDGIASVLNHIEDRIWQSGHVCDQRVVQPHVLYSMESTPPNPILDKPVDCVTTKFVRSAMNKVKCPIYDICWTPEGRRLVTGASSGEFTLWNGTAFNFETILQAHDTAVRAIKWSHNDLWMISADHDGFIKYWQANMNNVTVFQAHKEAVRSVSFCPSDVKFATASDDGTVRVWDFLRCHEERILRGHGSDVRCVDWHPRKALLVSGSRDSQQPVKLWDPRSGQCLATLHDHKNAVMAALWNDNGNWLITGSRDHLVKLYDIRMMKEMMTFRGHKKEVTALAWHPAHEGLLVSGGADGALMFWSVTNDKEIGIIESAHEQAIWSLKWHPLGHILASGSNDNNTKFWTRNKAGDTLEDFYFVTANAYDHAAQQRVQAPPIPSSSSQQQQQPAGEKSVSDTTTTANASFSSTTPSTPTSADFRRSQQNAAASIIPGMGLEGEMFEKLREQQYAASTSAANLLTSSIGTQQATQLLEAGGIPGLGGIVVDSNDPLGLGGRKTLLKQPPPKKAQRQFERVWNVNSRLQGAMLGPEDEAGPPVTSDVMDYRKPKPSLLGAPPPSASDIGPPGPSSAGGPPIPSLLGPPQQQASSWVDPPLGGDAWRPQPPQGGGGGGGGGGMFMGDQMQQQQPFPPHPRHAHGSSSYLHSGPENMDPGRGGGGNRWLYGGGGPGDEGEHGDVDLRHIGGPGGGSGGGWGLGGGASPYDDIDYRDLPSSGGVGPPHGRGSNPRDPRMQPRMHPQQQQDLQSDYRFQNWLESGNNNSGGPPQQQIQPHPLDRRRQEPPSMPQSLQQQMIDPRRQSHQHQTPQSLLSLPLAAPPPQPSNGSGYGNQQMVSSGGFHHGGRSRSDDQDSDQELYGSMGENTAMGSGLSRNPSGGGGTPTNPKRKWKQEYEAEEAQGGAKRWALSTEDDSPPSASYGLPSNTGDKDERQIWGRGSGGGGRR